MLPQFSTIPLIIALTYSLSHVISVQPSKMVVEVSSAERLYIIIFLQFVIILVKKRANNKSSLFLVCSYGFNFNIFLVVWLENDKKKACRVEIIDSPTCLVIYELWFLIFSFKTCLGLLIIVE